MDRLELQRLAEDSFIKDNCDATRRRDSIIAVLTKNSVLGKEVYVFLILSVSLAHTTPLDCIRGGALGHHQDF